VTDPIAKLALWLAGHVEWWRHRPEADEFLSDVEACLRIVRGLARGPSEQRYLGPCGADLGDMFGRGCGGDVFEYAPPADSVCAGDVYAHRGAQRGACTTCGAHVATAERQAWLNELARSHAFTDRQIADAYPQLNVKTIRSWRDRGKLKTYYRNDQGIVVEWADPPDGVEREKLHYVGDVLDLAAADAARRETDRSTRARRRTTRHEGDAA
jgi:hypothetical protein